MLVEMFSFGKHDKQPLHGISWSLVIFGFFSILSLEVKSAEFSDYQWDVVNSSAAWTPRAGLQVVELNDQFYLMGGRTPLNPVDVPVFGASNLWGDVWKSDDRGASWQEILATDNAGHWSARAYFQSVTKGDEMYVLGGQNFNIIDNPAPFGPPQIPSSEFFNDVWSSSDGINWTAKTMDSGWAGRAGLSSIVFRDEIYVLGGSTNDDAAIFGPQGPPRIYFNDVWKSSNDGADWQQVTDAAPWMPRAGAAVVVKDDFIYLLGGEDGFTCDSGPRCPPYFNDVWRTQDGESWELVTESAGWPARPGHQAVLLEDEIVVFGGFGLSVDPTDPFKPANPMDMWSSPNGVTWEMLEQESWNASSPGDVKYDFDALVASTADGQDAIYSFGGDRETFNPVDPVNYLNVDNDVWSFSLVPEPSSLSLLWIGLLVGCQALRRHR